MQRLHIDDFTAFLLRTLKNHVHLSFPAIAPHELTYTLNAEGDQVTYGEGALLEADRLPEDYLEEMRAQQGAVYFAAQYQQAPLTTGGQILQRAWFKDLTEVRPFDYRVISIDPAFTKNAGDFSAALVCDIVGEDVQIVHMVQVQQDYPSVVRWIRGLEKAWKPDLFVIEAIGTGLGLPHHLRSYGIEHLAPIGGYKFSKIERMELAAPKVEAGRVLVPMKEKWADHLLEMLTRFPNGPKDDLPDALSQLLLYQPRIRAKALYHRERRNPPAPAPHPYGLNPGGVHYLKLDYF